VEALEQHDAGWGTGKLLQMDEAGEPTGRIYSVGHAILRDGYFFNIGYGMDDDGQFDEGREVFGAPGAAALYSAELIEDISYQGEFFDEQIFMYGEDTDVDWRARNEGWKCWYAPRAVAHHRGSETSGNMRDEAVIARYRSVLKNAPLVPLILYNLPVMLGHVILRLLITPRSGSQLFIKSLQLLPSSLNGRKPGISSIGAMNSWFKWSHRQASRQPLSWWVRLTRRLQPNS
jgi:GT2 family glycosyltransferase